MVITQFMTRIISPLLVVAFLLVPLSTFAKTSTVHVDAGDGMVVEGGVNYTWDTVHDATTAPQEWPTYYKATAMSRWTTPQLFGISRAFLPFDTSWLPDNSTIVSASLKLMPQSRVVGDADAQAYIQPVGPSTQNSFTTLIESDYDQCGSVDSPTTWSDTKNTYSDTWSDGTYVSFPLNTAGISGVSLNNYTPICVREGHDIEDSAPTSGSGNKENEWAWYQIGSTGNVGGAKDSLLEITYSVPPTPPELLYTEATSTPINVTDGTPEFSAVFKDPDTSDTATFYKIQVATSSDAWGGSLLWDSGKTSIGSPIANGARSADISFGGSSLSTDGKTYYWRIKFWDSNGSEGMWSGPHYFTMD